MVRSLLSFEDRVAIARLRQLEAEKPQGWWDEAMAILREGAERKKGASVGGGADPVLGAEQVVEGGGKLGPERSRREKSVTHGASQSEPRGAGFGVPGCDTIRSHAEHTKNVPRESRRDKPETR